MISKYRIYGIIWLLIIVMPVVGMSAGSCTAFLYDTPGKPYAISGIEADTPAAIPQRDQSVTYTSFERPAAITEDGCEAGFTYDADGNRMKMQVKRNGSVEYCRYYLGRYEADYSGNTAKSRRLYIGGDAYSAPAVYLNTGAGWKLHYICRDHLGSITHLIDAGGAVVQELGYDAWGRLRDPATQQPYGSGAEPDLLLGRGYTGHEHLPMFGLLNMNARLYDPAVGRFLSPDPFVQMPDFSQNFNRYSYCLNNPLKYTDENGEIAIWIPIIAGVVGGVTNLAANWKNIDGFWQGVAAFGAGAGAGVAAVFTGGAGASIWAVGGVAAIGGAATAGTNSVIAQTGHNFEGFGQVDWGQVGISATVGGMAGFAGGAAGYGAANVGFLVNGVSSPVLRSAVVSPLAAGAGHVAGNTTANLFAGQDFGDAFVNSFDGIGQSMAVGGTLGVASSIGVSYASGVNPWTGKALNTLSLKGRTDFFEGSHYSDKVLYQMLKDDFHSFPESVKAFQQNGYTTTIMGGDGIIRIQLHIPGTYKGHNGEFLFLKEPNGLINHRIFQPYTK